MEYRKFGRTGVNVSPICLGCMMFGGRTSPEDAYDIVDCALDAGINFFDTANVYGRGRNEEIVGEAFKRNAKRRDVILATKVRLRMGDGPNDSGPSRRHIIEQCEASLRRLKTDYIDLYQLHGCDPTVPFDEPLQALDDLIRAGKVRYVGTSSHASWQIVESIWISKELGLNRVVSEQPAYNILDRRVERELLPMAVSYRMAIMPWAPLAEGLLSGKYRLNRDVPPGMRYSDASLSKQRKFQQGIPVPENVLSCVEALIPIAESNNVNLAQFSLSWLLHQRAITSAIVGARTLDQLKDIIGAIDVKLSDSDLARVDEVVTPGTHIAPYYDCGRQWDPMER